MFQIGVYFLLFAATVWIWTSLWRQTMLDKYRDRMFDVRDSLRDYFLEHSLSLSEPAYLNIRSSINRSIHFLGSITFLKLLHQIGAYSGVNRPAIPKESDQ